MGDLSAEVISMVKEKWHGVKYEYRFVGEGSILEAESSEEVDEVEDLSLEDLIEEETPS